jgi:hypothetical protein
MKNNVFLSNQTVAFSGALLGIAAVFAYSLIVMFFVIGYSSTIIFEIMPAANRSSILFMSGFSVAYSVVVFSLLMAVPSSVAGILIAVTLKKLLLYFNPIHRHKKALLISGITVTAAILLVYLLLWLNGWATFPFSETVWFWFLYPAILFSTVCLIGGTNLNAFLAKGIPEAKTTL